MASEVLNAVVLNGYKGTPPTNLELIRNHPRLRISGQAKGPEECLALSENMAVDLVVVDLNQEAVLPAWLEDLTRSLPQATVMVCSANQDRQFLIRAMQSGVREFLPLPLVPSDLQAALDRTLAAKRWWGKSEQAGQIVAVAGLRGGVGATSIAINLAVALGERYPGRVALVDLGRPFPNVAKFLNQDKKNGFLNLAENKDHLDPDFVLKSLQPHEGKFGVLHGFDIAETELIEPLLVERVLSLLRPSFDWILVDLGNWLDEIYFRVMQEADQVVLLTELIIPDLQNLKRLTALYQQWHLDLKKVRLVINRYNKVRGLGFADLERFSQLPVYFTLPSDYHALSEAINHGIPLAAAAPRSKLWRSLKLLGNMLIESLGSDSLPAADQEKKSRRRFIFF